MDQSGELERHRRKETAKTKVSWHKIRKGETQIAKNYRKKDMEVKRSLRKNNRAWANNIPEAVQHTARRGQMKNIYKMASDISRGRGAASFK